MIIKALTVTTLLFMTTFSFAGDEFSERYCPPEESKKVSDKLMSQVNEFIVKQNKSDPFKAISPLDGGCLIALYNFFEKINSANNKEIHFNIKNYRSVSCFRKKNITNLYLQAVSVVCNKKHDVRQTGYKAFKIILNSDFSKQNNGKFCEKDKRTSNRLVCNLRQE